MSRTVSRAKLYEVQLYAFRASDYGVQGDVQIMAAPPEIQTITCKVLSSAWGKGRGIMEMVRVAGLPADMSVRGYDGLCRAIREAMERDHGIRIAHIPRDRIMLDDSEY